MTYYLGTLGNLTALPDPEAGLSMPVERIGGSHQLLSGAKVRDTIGYIRSWQLTWTAITTDVYAQLENFYYGVTGGGPYWFVDPELRNLLPMNVATGTDMTGTTAGFTLVSGTQILSTNAFAANDGSYVLRWDPTATGQIVQTGTGPFSTVTSAQLATFVPVIVGNSYTASYYARWSNAAATVHARIYWYSAAGANLSSSVGSDTALTTSYQRITVTGTAPANAGAARLAILTSTTTAPAAGAQVLADSLQFEAGSSVTAWTRGQGASLVTVEALSRSTPLAGICDAQMTLVQVA